MAREIKLGKKMIGDGLPARILPGKFLWILLALLSIFLMASVLAAPREAFFLNHVQKQCALDISGDENSDFIPLYPWQEARPDANGMILTKFGSCNLREVHNQTLSPQDCCKKLGYTLYEGEIPGFWRDQSAPEPCSSLGILFIVGVAIFLFIKLIKHVSNKQKTTGEQNGS